MTQILGGEAISDFQGLRHLAPVTGPVPSTPDRMAGPGRGRPTAPRFRAVPTGRRPHDMTCNSKDPLMCRELMNSCPSATADDTVMDVSKELILQINDKALEQLIPAWRHQSS